MHNRDCCNGPRGRGILLLTRVAATLGFAVEGEGGGGVLGWWGWWGGGVADEMITNVDVQAVIVPRERGVEVVCRAVDMYVCDL
jgi:hypothetical protein